MAQSSRPIRAMMLILGGWVTGRIIVLATPDGPPVDQLAAVAAAVVPPAAATDSTTGFNDVPLSQNEVGMTQAARVADRAPLLPSVIVREVAITQVPTLATSAKTAALTEVMTETAAPVTVALPPPKYSRAESLLSGSLWLLARPGREGGLATGGQLGASQGGFRVNYAVAGPVFVTARASAPFEGLGRQSSVGMGIKGKRAGVLVERWVALDRGGRDDFAVTAYGGIDGIVLPAGARLDAYAQAGVVGRDAFADAAVRVERDAAKLGPVNVAVGVGAWGGVQPGVARLDIGPQIVARVPVARRTLRLSTEWRQRVGGQAAPASGPAVTLGMDF